MKFLLVVILVAVAVYLLVRMAQRRGLPPSRGARPTNRPTEPRRVIAPDDDPDFLRDLDRKKRSQDDTDT